ncbi:MAG TPA: isoprenylcysteine carboxylmethyltransferase family protein [Acidobacteriota bacterium]|nr:isoprenylcysteine carboxylmethyltransferase family protein [Acidobacteriota bacterium]
MRIALVLIWAIYLALFLRSLKGSLKAKETSWVGLAGLGLQFAGLGCILSFRRSPGTPGYWIDTGLNSLGMACAVAGVVVTRAALQRLGEHWSMTSRLRQQHQLITDGPFARVRHPLYLSFFLLTLGTALTVSDWVGMALGLPLSLAGAALRGRMEDRLLRREFGEQFERYAGEVPFLLPDFLSRSSSREG